MKSTQHKFQEKIAELFGVDLRSLALCRIGLGLLIIIDLMMRSSDLMAHYSDEGLLPRQAVYDLFNYPGIWLSPYFFSGSAIFQGCLFVLTGIFAFFLMVGYYTRISAIICWFLLISLHDRNTMILYGGDGILRMTLFWCLFLPTEAYGSIDRLLSSSKHAPPSRIISMATVAILLQVCIIYWQGIGYKWNSSWFQGNAIEYALNLDEFVSPAGLWLKEQHTLLKPLTYLTFYMEMLGPLLAFCPFYTGPIRIFVVFAFSIMHICFGLFLELGLFPAICITSWLPFLPSYFWDVFLPRLHFPFQWFTQVRERIAPFFHNFRKRPLISTTSLVENLFAGFLIVYVILLNISGVMDWKPPLIGNWGWKKLANALHIDQAWTMFSVPLYDSGWYVVSGSLLNGKHVDLFDDGKKITWKKPKTVSHTFGNDRWRKYMTNIWWKENYKLRPYYGRYLCHSWNSQHSGLEQLKSVKIFFMWKKIDLNEKEKIPYEPILLWEHVCRISPES